MVKTKALIREKIWFPGIDHKIEAMIKECIACQATEHPKQNTEPLRMTKLPEKAWEEVSVDFCGPIPGTNDQYLLVIVDDYSRYPVIEPVKFTSADVVIPVMDKVFATFGTPQVVKTDNGPPFNSTKFAEFSKYLGFRHRKITPYWPRANGEAERMMRNVNKTLRAAQLENIPWKQALWSFLRSYRATQHTTTGVAPADLLLGYKPRIQLPELNTNRNRDTKLRTEDKAAKDKIKEYADRPSSVKHKIGVGDTVLVRQMKKNKLTPPYSPHPCEVVAVKNSMITARRSSPQ